MPSAPIGLSDLVSILGRSTKDPEVRTLFAGVEFLRFNQTFSGGDRTAPNAHAARSRGFEFCSDPAGMIRVCYAYGLEAKAGYDPFAGPLLAGITFLMPPAAVQDILGPPSRSGPAVSIPKVGKVGPWDRWDRETFSMHVQYVPSGRRIQTITVMSPDMVP